MLILPSLVQFRGPQAVILAEATMGGIWALLWFKYASDPPRSDRMKASAAGFGESTTYGNNKSLLPVMIENGIHRKKSESELETSHMISIPWKSIMLSWPVWAIVVNNFTFHYALYVLMNWLPTYFEKGLQLSLQKMGSSKMLPYLNMFLFSNIGGVIADHLITRRLLSVTKTRKLLNTGGFVVAAFALMIMPSMRTSWGAVISSSVSLGFLALGRAGFAVNHLDIAPRYAGIVMGVSNTAGTLAGVVGVGLTGQILESAKAAGMDLTNPNTWTQVFYVPAFLCIFSAVIFLLFSTGERIFD